MTEGTPSLSVFFAQPYNPGSTAQLYSSLAAVLAGFAFTGLMLFLNAEFKADTKSSRSQSKSVVSTLFCAMSSLTICAFLYGRAAGESVANGRTFLTLALYGVVLAPAVLSLFYALNLVMLSRKSTARVAVDTRWVVAAVGPAVVMSLLADLLANAWAYGCRGCPMWISPRLWGFVFAASFLVFGLMTSLLAADIADRRWLKPVKYPVARFLNLPPVVACAKFFRRRRSSPAFITLNLTWVVAVFSLWARGIPDGFTTRAWTHVVLGFAALVMAVFAFAAGSVLDESVFTNSRRPRRRHRSGGDWGATAAGPDLNRRDTTRHRPAPRLG